MVKRIRRILVVVVGVALMHGAPITTALALDPPGGPEISSTLAAELPAYWSVQSVEITASVNDGDDVTPRYRQRFVADAIPKENLYLAVSDDDRVGPFRMLITTHAATRTRKLYGVATTVVSLGKWSTEISLENSVKGVGMPRSLYAGPVVVAGTEQADDVAQEFLKLHSISKTVTEGMVRRTASSEALKKLAAEEQAALEQANRKRLAALEEKYRQEMVAFIAGMERERQQLEAASEVRLARVKAELKEEIAAVERRKVAADRERKLLVEENRRVIDELTQRFKDGRAAFAAAAERERQQYVTANRKHLAALKSQIQEETSKLDEQAVALDRERKLLVEENQRKLNALQAQFERKRAEITAVAATLDATARAEAEAQAQKKLAEARKTLAGETKRAAEATQQARDAENKERNARYNSIIAALRSKDLAERNATFDAVFQSDDEHLKKTAIAEAMQSGDDGLQAKALATLIVKSPQIGITITFKDERGNEKIANQILHVTSVDENSLSFSGRFQPAAADICVPGSIGYRPEYAPKGSGSVQRDRLTLAGYWFRSRQSHENACNRPSQYSCNITAQVNDKGILAGVATCGEYKYSARISL